jgi:cytochrome c oxidase subunit IV
MAEAAHHAASRRTYYIVFGTLMVCTYLTWQVAYFDLGPFNTVAAIGIAILKATLVVLFFMHVKDSSRLTWAVVLGALFWFGILIVLTMSDYLTRAWQTFG